LHRQTKERRPGKARKEGGEFAGRSKKGNQTTLSKKLEDGGKRKKFLVLVWGGQEEKKPGKARRGGYKGREGKEVRQGNKLGKVSKKIGKHILYRTR